MSAVFSHSLLLFLHHSSSFFSTFLHSNKLDEDQVLNRIGTKSTYMETPTFQVMLSNSKKKQNTKQKKEKHSC